MAGLLRTTTSVSESRPWFLLLFDRLRVAWAEHRNAPPPLERTAAPIDVPEIWSPHKTAAPRIVSVLVHLLLIGAALIPFAKAPKQLPKGRIDIALYAPSRLSLPQSDHGGGGGGRHAPTPPSLGRLPRAADKQLVPPDPEPPKNLDPSLIVEASLVAPLLSMLPHLNLLNIGDPDGVPGPPSGGPGDDYGIGDGDGHGIGDRKGPGFGPDDGGGFSNRRFRITGAVSNPVLIAQVLPEYSEEARKARYEGRVILDTTILEDGTVQVVRVVRGIGYGLEEKAISAVLQWRFKPARVDGKPVPVALNIEVNFNLR